MKKFFLSSILLAFVLVLQAQPSMSVSGGVKLIKPDQRTITLWYVDESPSMDNIYTDFKQTGNLAVQASFRLQDVNSDKKIHLFGEVQGYLGGLNGIALNAGGFYANYTESKFRVQPEIGVILGYCSKSIGVIENNDVYIQVNNTKFQDYTNVNAALSNVYLGIKPGISFITPVGSSSEIGIGVNYQLSIKFGRVAFSGTDDSGNATRDFENLKANNVSFSVDGENTDKIPFNPDGLEFKIFYSF